MDKHHQQQPKEDKICSEDQQELEKKCEEYLHGWKRAQADYENLKKTTEKEKLEWVKLANQGILLQLLPIYDHLKLAIKHIPEGEKKTNWVVGIVNIKNQLTKFLSEAGVEEIKTVGEKFNPEEHEAVAVSEDNIDNQEEEISEELHPGYKLHGKVLYPAKVKI
ncbi:nucleotide exchange factor GrpE [Candidatus Kuenenbacteria bacterium]|nr:nucleotide exchange factor GrpE [Candidatus Kuenenbacteria bacterium]